MLSRQRISALAAVFGLFTFMAVPAQDRGTVPTPKLIIKGHAESVYSVQFNKDAGRIATGSFDKSLKIWDATDGKLIREFSGPNAHTGLVLSVSFSAKGDMIASGSTDNTARVWDVPVSTPVREQSFASGATSVAISVDGKLGAAGAQDGTVRIWNQTDGKPVANWSAHPGGTLSVAFSADAKQLMTSGADGFVRVWNTADGKPIAAIAGHAGPATAVATGPTPNTVTSIGADSAVRTWQIPTAPGKTHPPHNDAVSVMALSPDGGTLLVGAKDKSLRTSLTVTGAVAKDFAGLTGIPESAAWSANGTQIAVGQSDGKIAVYSVGDAKMIASVPAHPGGVTGIAFHANGQSLHTTGRDGKFRTWTFPLSPAKSSPLPDRFTAMTASADGKRWIIGGADKVVRVVTAGGPTVEKQFAGNTAVITSVGITPDATMVFSTAEDGTIRFWKMADGSVAGILTGHDGAVTGSAIAPTGQYLVTCGVDGAIKSWAIPLIPAVNYAHPEAVTAVWPSADGTKVWTLASDRQLRQFTLGTPTPTKTAALGAVAPSAVAVHSDGTTLAVAFPDKSVSIRTAEKESKKLTLPTEAKSVAFIPNGTQILTGGADNTIRLVTIADGKEAKSIPGHTAPVTGILIGPKADVFATWSADKTVRIWSMADQSAKGKIDVPAVPTSVAYSKDGSKLVVTSDKSATIYTTADLKPQGTITLPTPLKGSGFSPDGLRLVVTGDDGRVRIVGPDMKTWEWNGHDGPAHSASFLADGKRVVSVGNDKMLRTWTPAVSAQSAGTAPVRKVLLTTAADRVLSVGDDKQLKIWDAKTLKDPKVIPAGDAALSGMSMSNDGTRIAVVGADKKLAVWNPADGKALFSTVLPSPAVAVAISPNGRTAAVSMADGTAQVVRTFDINGGQELQQVHESTAPIRYLQFAADNRLLLTAGDDKSAVIADAAVSAAMTVHPGGAVGLGLNPAAPQVVTTGADKTVKLWDMTTGKEVRTVATTAEPPGGLAVSRDGSVIAVSYGKAVRILQVADGKELAALHHPADVLTISWNTDKTRLITGAADNVARLWEVAGGKLLQLFPHAGPVRGVAIHPALPIVFTGSADKTVLSHPVAIIRTVPIIGGIPRALTLTANGTHFLVGGDDKLARSFAAGNGNEDKKYEGSTGAVQAIAVTKNVQSVAVGGADKVVRIYGFADAKLVGSINTPSPIRGLSFFADGKSLAGILDDKSVVCWNTTFQAGQPLPEDFGKVIQQFQHADLPTFVAVGEKGEVMTSSADKTVKQWRVASPTAVRSYAHPALVDGVAWSPDGKTLATACHDGILRTFDLEKTTPLKAINAHTTPAPPSPIYSVQWTPDGKSLLTTSFDKSLKLWDAGSGNMVREFKGYAEKTFEKGHQDQVFCAAFNRDMRLLASGSSDRTIKLWNVADGSVVRDFVNPTLKNAPGQAHPGGIYGLKFTPDDRFLVSVGPAPRNQGYLAIWNAADGKLVYQTEVPFGPIFSMSMSADGSKLVIGCGPKVRQVPEAEALVIPLPMPK